MRWRMDHRWRMPSVAALAMFIAGPAARADECFCLMQPATGAILRSCEAYKAPADFYPTAVCADPETGLKSEQTMYSDWLRIEAGADRCDPCRRTMRGAAPEVPRKPAEGRNHERRP